MFYGVLYVLSLKEIDVVSFVEASCNYNEGVDVTQRWFFKASLLGKICLTCYDREEKETSHLTQVKLIQMLLYVFVNCSSSGVIFTNL